MPGKNGKSANGHEIVKARILNTASIDAHCTGKIITWEWLGFKEGEIIDIELFPVGSPRLEWHIGRVKARKNVGYVSIIHGEVELISR